MSTPALSVVRWPIVRMTDQTRVFTIKNKKTGRPIDISAWTGARIRFRQTPKSAYYFERTTEDSTMDLGGTSGTITTKFTKDEVIPLGTYYGDLIAMTPNLTPIMRIELIVEETNDNPPQQPVSVDLLATTSDLAGTPLGIETTARISADASLAALISTDASLDASAYASIASEVSTDSSAEAVADLSLAAIVSSAESASATADSSLAAAISLAASTETAARTSTDASLAAALASDHSTDASLAVGISSEESRAEQAESSISSRLLTDEAAIISETTARTSADASLDAAIDLLAGDIDELTADQSAADASLASQLSAGASAAQLADASNASAISAELTQRTSVDAALSSSLASEASARSSADVSLASAITAEASTRSTADMSLASSITAEISTRTAQDALKLDKSGGTMTGSLTANGGISTTTLTTSGAVTSAGAVTSGSDSSVGAFVVDGPSGSYRTFAFKTAGFTGQKLQLNAAGNFEVQDYDDAGAWIRSWLIHNRLDGTTTLAGPLTAATITNYATAVTTSALLALTPAQSAAKRLAYVSDCYNLSGTLTGGLAHWLGDATAGTWVLSDCGVVVTRDKYAFLTSLADTVTNIPVARNRRLISLPLMATGRGSSGDWATVSGTNAVARHSSVTGNPQYIVYDTGTTATGVAARSATAGIVAAIGKMLNRGTGAVLAASDATDSFRAWSGFLGSGVTSPSALYSKACFIYDPQNTSGLGISNANWWAVTSTNAGVTTLTDTGIAPASNAASQQLLEVYLEPYVKAEFRIAGALVATHTTNLPDNQIRPSEGIQKASGTAARSIVAADQHFAFLA